MIEEEKNIKSNNRFGRKVLIIIFGNVLIPLLLHSVLISIINSSVIFSDASNNSHMNFGSIIRLVIATNCLLFLQGIVNIYLGIREKEKSLKYYYFAIGILLLFIVGNCARALF